MHSVLHMNTSKLSININISTPEQVGWQNSALDLGSKYGH